MKKLTFLAMVIFAVAVIGTTGCPGTKKTTATGPTGTGGTPAGGGDALDSFELATSPKTADIKQGATQKVKVSVTRQKNYKQGDDPIKVKAEVTKGDVTVEPAKGTELKADQNDFEFSITAKAEAKVGEAYEVKFTANGPHEKGANLTVTGKTIAK